MKIRWGKLFLMGIISTQYAFAEYTDEARALKKKLKQDFANYSCEQTDGCVLVRNYCDRCIYVKEDQRARIENNVATFYESQGELDKKCVIQCSNDGTLLKIIKFPWEVVKTVAGWTYAIVVVLPVMLISSTRSSSSEISLVESKKVIKKNVKPGEIGYEFNFTRPLIEVSNYEVGAEKGYGSAIALVNNMTASLEEINSAKDAIEYAHYIKFNKNKINMQLSPLSKKFLIINKVKLSGGFGDSGHLVYIVRDPSGKEFFVGSKLMPFSEEYYFDEEKDAMAVLQALPVNQKFIVRFEGSGTYFQEVEKYFPFYKGRVIKEISEESKIFTELEVSQSDVGAILAMKCKHNCYTYKEKDVDGIKVKYIYSNESARKDMWKKFERDLSLFRGPDFDPQKGKEFFNEFRSIASSQGFQEPVFNFYRNLLLQTGVLQGRETNDPRYEKMMILEKGLLENPSPIDPEKPICPTGYKTLYFFTTVKICFLNNVKNGPFEIWETKKVEPSIRGEFKDGKILRYESVKPERKYQYKN